MFQRLKGAIDSRIAEEQARQRQAALSASSARPGPSQPRRNQNGTPVRRTSRQRENQELSPEKGPDPAEFDAEFAIGDDESAVPSRVGTPLPDVKEKAEEKQETGAAVDAMQEAAESKPESRPESISNAPSPAPAPKAPELPTEVRVKLRKLDRLEGRYQELLKAYRTAHARVQLIEPFEASLRENTPLTSIGDPGALIEYLNQTNLKSDMLLEELKRVSADRDEYKKKFEESERTATGLRSEVAELKSKMTMNGAVPEQGTRLSLEVNTAEPVPKEAPDTPATTKSPAPSHSRIPSLSLFSPKSKAKSPPPKETSEEFFSYDSEIPRLESELEERQGEVEGLKKQLESVKGDLAVARESTESMVQTLESATRELHGLRDAKDKFDSTSKQMRDKIDELQAKVNEGQHQCKDLQKQLEELQAEKDKALEDLKMTEEQKADLSKSTEEAKAQIANNERITKTLNEKVAQKDATVKDLEDTLAMYKSAERQEAKKADEDVSSEKRMATMQSIMDSLKTQLDHAETTVAGLKQEISANQDEFAKRPSTKVFGFLDNEKDPALNGLDTREAAVRYLADKFNLHEVGENKAESTGPSAPAPQPEAGGAGKKKNKKKKKGGKGGPGAGNEATEHEGPIKVTEDLGDAEDEPHDTPAVSTPVIEQLQKEIDELKEQIESRNASIDRLSAQLKDQEAMREEIETLRDDLLHQGEEHVEARNALKAALAQKKALEDTVEQLEKELVEVQKKLTSGEESEKAHSELMAQFEELKIKSTTLRTDLAAAEQLAAARFKDITDLRELLTKAQPELRSLRSEVAELKSVKESLKNKTGELNRLEARHEDLKAEIKGLSKRLGDKDAEIKDLNQKIEQEASTRSRAEDDLRVAQSDLRYSEARKQESIESATQTSKDLAKAKEETLSLKARMRDLDEQISTHSKQVSGLREELSLKTALHNTSQSLVQSLRDQTHELSTQARESGTRAESLEEELAETQRMLSERTRESQTMRMLLSQAETGTEARIREMKERMEAAIEDRDRVEDEASVASRRMAREVEDVRGKARDSARQVKVLEDEKEEVDGKLRELRRRLAEVEGVSERSEREAVEVRATMDRLREALDESERQVSELEGQRFGLRKELEEARERVEKLVKANKSLSEEMKSVGHGLPRKPNVRPGGMDSGVQSSRSSFDSAAGGVRSPAPRDRVASPALTARSDNPTGPTAGTVDYVYLKNVLLQFLEQKDKGHQKQLVPVLGMLLHFDRKDEQKWMAAISAR